MARIVKINYDEKFFDAVAENKKGADDAIGYLVCWAIQSPRHTNASLYGERNGDVSARYANDQNERTYDIFAQRQADGSYSFHS